MPVHPEGAVSAKYKNPTGLPLNVPGITPM